jgi:hypothetical protein
METISVSNSERLEQLLKPHRKTKRVGQHWAEML